MFVLAQFSIASAAPTVGAVVTVDPLPTFSHPGQIGSLDYSLVLPGDAVQNVLVYWRVGGNPWTADYCNDQPGNVNSLTAATGSFPYVIGVWGDQDVSEWYVLVINTDDTVDDAPANGYDDDCDNHVAFMNAAPEEAQVSTFIDDGTPEGIMGNPPYLDGDSDFSNNPASCNTFEMWAVASEWEDNDLGPGDGYSGFKDWNTSTTGTFSPPAPEGAANAFLSWVYTFPSTASGPWSFSINPEDYAGNNNGDTYFRDGFGIVSPAELADCADFTDTAGDPNEVYIRYLADLGLISGFADGTFGAGNTLTRAEASALFEKANGWADATGLPTSAPSAACTFTDVSASDWFAGWVWQACDDGFMNGIGGGLFDPNNLLTRGQVVTIFHNIALSSPYSGAMGSYLEDNFTFNTVINQWWWNEWDDTVNEGEPPLRSIGWTDMYIGDYYAVPAMIAYSLGVADATGATTFSPNQAATRGEFAKMLYRVLSRAYEYN
jgi:hypothetical protein